MTSDRGGNVKPSDFSLSPWAMEGEHFPIVIPVASFSNSGQALALVVRVTGLDLRTALVSSKFFVGIEAPSTIALPA